ncbi:MAG: hypothetical protein LBE86_00990 [Gemmobacter sp.]|jgi:hypothetical protein|nr:hypothetical protein [Gemmobacter sp.]
MNKLVALICVISWSGFWAFGYLALSAGVEDATQITVATILAAIGFFSGMIAWLKLSRDERLPPVRS